MLSADASVKHRPLGELTHARRGVKGAENPHQPLADRAFMATDLSAKSGCFPECMTAVRSSLFKPLACVMRTHSAFSHTGETVRAGSGDGRGCVPGEVRKRDGSGLSRTSWSDLRRVDVGG